MPELTIIHLALLAAMLVLGAALGWILRGERSTKEKIAVNASWQEQLESQHAEHERLAEQNKSLMEQISQYQATHKESADRVAELTASLKEAYASRDDLQERHRDNKNALQLASAERDKLISSVAKQDKQLDYARQALAEKDEKVFRLKRELGGWSSRLPSLVERYKTRDREAIELEAELADTRQKLEAAETELGEAGERVENIQSSLEAARKELASLTSVPDFSETRVEPVNVETLPGGLDASNEPHNEKSLRFNATRDGGDESPPEDDELVEEPETVDEYAYSGDELLAAETFVEIGDRVWDIPAPGAGNGSAPGDADGDSEEDGDEDAGVADQASAEDEQATPADEDPDDLKQIKGIGPAIEKTLNELGIWRYEQIADMSEYEIDRVAQQIKGFRSRIYREDWLGQARDLHQQKNKHPV